MVRILDLTPDPKPQPEPRTGPLLTWETIEEWKAEYIDYSDQIAEMKLKFFEIGQRLAGVEGKLQAAIPFVPELGKWLDEQATNIHQLSLPDAIVKVLKAVPQGILAQQGLTRDEIRSQLPKHGYAESKLAASPNYFYTALRRLEARGIISEQSSGEYHINPDAAERTGSFVNACGFPVFT